MQPEVVNMLKADATDAIDFVVLNEHDALLMGNAELLALVRKNALPWAETPIFLTTQLQHDTIRLMAWAPILPYQALHIAVSQTRRQAGQNTRQIVLHALWPNVLLLCCILVLIARGIGQALRPLQALGNHVDRRTANDLAPLPTEHVMQEIVPLVNAINGLFGKIEQSSADQHLFLSGAAHQLRTPLAIIQTQLELAKQEALPAQHQRFDRMQQSIQRLTHCTQQMLALARSSNQFSHDATTTNIDIAALIEDMASHWLDAALGKHIELVFELQPAVCQGSPWMIQEMLGNVVDNAIKYSPPQSCVTIRCGVNAQQLSYMSVQDQGAGVSPDVLAQIFKPFFRANWLQTEGSGLGLTIVHEIAKRHHIDISMQNASLTAGTVVCMSWVFDAQWGGNRSPLAQG